MPSLPPKGGAVWFTKNGGDTLNAFDRITSFIEALESIAGIDRLDFGIRRQDSTFIQRDLQSLNPLAIKKALPFLRAENAKGSDVYFRPARHESWPVIFLDDLTNRQAGEIGRKYQSWVIETSPGLHHTWILTDRPLSITERYLQQSRIVSLGFGDHGSVSGEHFGRLPGFKNWKRGGPWVNVVRSPDTQLPRLSPSYEDTVMKSVSILSGSSSDCSGGDASESGREWGFVCGSLEIGIDPEIVRRNLEIRARERGKKNPQGYALKTVSRASAKRK